MGRAELGLPPNAKFCNESAVPELPGPVELQFSPLLAAALPDFLLPCGSNLLRTSMLSGRSGNASRSPLVVPSGDESVVVGIDGSDAPALPVAHGSVLGRGIVGVAQRDWPSLGYSLIIRSPGGRATPFVLVRPFYSTGVAYDGRVCQGQASLGGKTSPQLGRRRLRCRGDLHYRLTSAQEQIAADHDLDGRRFELNLRSKTAARDRRQRRAPK